MSQQRSLSRRDFLNGCALSLAAGTSLSPLEVLARGNDKASYPPALTGLRGNHPGSFEVAHALARGGRRWPTPTAISDDEYDLVVVGGGISGLAAAYFYRERHPAARILVLDNHDDFGGHAKRNEFRVDGRTVIGYGGSQSLESPGAYSAVAAGLLRDIGIRLEPFYDYFDRDFFTRHGLAGGILFSAASFGRDHVAPDLTGSRGEPVPADLAGVLAACPLPPEARESWRRLLTARKDYLPDRAPADKARYLQTISYSDFLRRHAAVHADVVRVLRDTVKGYWGIGWDALSALEGWRLGGPGTAHLGLDGGGEAAPGAAEPYIFHFPDGNAAVARALVRQLLPAALAGNSMHELVTGRLDYGELDRRGAAMRLRLNSTAVNVQHTADRSAVDVTYVRGGDVHRVRGRHVVLACYNQLIPHLCPETPSEQVDALAWPSKTPLVYISVALRNWRAFADRGYHRFYVPDSPLMHTFGLDFPVSIGDYRYTSGPHEAAVIHGGMVPTQPDQGLSRREQHTAGRRRLYEMSFDDFERGIFAQMSAALGSGFDVERDVAALTVNRWPHGYAYEYHELHDPADWGRDRGPHLAARARIGRISIANSDSEAYAYVDGAIDAACRAVGEQCGDTV